MDGQKGRQRQLLMGENQSMFGHQWEKFFKKIQNTYEIDRKMKEQSERSLESGRAEVGEYCFVKIQKRN